MGCDRSSGAPDASDGVCGGRPVTVHDLSLAELRAYARQIDGPDIYDRAALIHYCLAYHVHNSNHDDNNYPAHNHNAGTDRLLGQR